MSSRGRTAGMNLCGSLTWKRSTKFRPDRSWPCRDCLGALLSLLFSCSAARGRVSGFHSMFLVVQVTSKELKSKLVSRRTPLQSHLSGTPVDGIITATPSLSSWPASLPPTPEVFRGAGDQCVFRAGVEAVSYQCSPAPAEKERLRERTEQTLCIADESAARRAAAGSRLQQEKLLGEQKRSLRASAAALTYG